MGGDEVLFPCWNTTQEIIDWLAAHNRGRSKLDFQNLWGEYQQQAYRKLQGIAPNAIPIVWTSELVIDEDLSTKYVPPSEYIIEVWESSNTTTVPDLLDRGYRLIIADAW